MYHAREHRHDRLTVQRWGELNRINASTCNNLLSILQHAQERVGNNWSRAEPNTNQTWKTWCVLLLTIIKTAGCVLRPPTPASVCHAPQAHSSSDSVPRALMVPTGHMASHPTVRVSSVLCCTVIRSLCSHRCGMARPNNLVSRVSRTK